MQGKYLFEYAVIRVVPKVEREEFVNAGVLLYCADQQFLKMLFEINEPRLAALAAHLDIAEVKAALCSFQRICDGSEDAGPIGLYTMPERFRWLTATRSTIIQTSSVHPGFCNDAGEMLAKLYHQLVC